MVNWWVKVVLFFEFLEKLFNKYWIKFDFFELFFFVILIIFFVFIEKEIGVNS